MQDVIEKIREELLVEYRQCLKDIVIGDYLMLRWKDNVDEAKRTKCQDCLVSKCGDEHICAIYEKSESNEQIWAYAIEPERPVAQVGCCKMPGNVMRKIVSLLLCALSLSVFGAYPIDLLGVRNVHVSPGYLNPVVSGTTQQQFWMPGAYVV